MNKLPTISIVIPAYNEEEFIGACLNSITKQTVKPEEVIVVDNNSTDATAEIAKQYDFVKLIHEKRQGLYFSRESGMAAAKGEILGRIDADTLLEPNWVHEVKSKFANYDTAALTGPVGYYDMPLPKLSQYFDNLIRKTLVRSGYFFLAGANMAIRSRDWDLIKDELCNEKDILEDIDISTHLLLKNRPVLYDPEMIAAMSSRRFSDKPKDFFRYLGGHTRTIDQHDIKNFGAGLAEVIIGSVYIGLKPWHSLYDPTERQFRLGKLKNPSKSRPDPMNMD